MGFQLIYEHQDAIGLLDGRKVKASTIAATAMTLACRGAEKLLIPTPGSYEYDRTCDGIEKLPKERRSYVSIVDQNGDILREVREFLSPLVIQATKWPENAFIQSCELFLYQVALGAKLKAGILSHQIQTVRGLLPLIHPNEFYDEARFRLAELVNLICCYEPNTLEQGAQSVDSVPDVRTLDVWKLLDSTEFKSIVASSGQLGILKHPNVILKHLNHLFKEFIQRPDTSKVLRLAETPADLAGHGKVFNTAKSALEALIAFYTQPFRPPFMSPGPAEMGIYKIALTEEYPSAMTHPGTILLFEWSRGETRSYSWLNEGDELKLEREAGDNQKRIEDFKKARQVQQTFLSYSPAEESQKICGKVLRVVDREDG